MMVRHELTNGETFLHEHPASYEGNPDWWLLKKGLLAPEAPQKPPRST